jgi:hypothetical protein
MFGDAPGILNLPAARGTFVVGRHPPIGAANATLIRIASLVLAF